MAVAQALYVLFDTAPFFCIGPLYFSTRTRTRVRVRVRAPCRTRGSPAPVRTRTRTHPWFFGPEISTGAGAPACGCGWHPHPQVALVPLSPCHSSSAMKRPARSCSPIHEATQGPAAFETRSSRTTARGGLRPIDVGARSFGASAAQGELENTARRRSPSSAQSRGGEMRRA